MSQRSQRLSRLVAHALRHRPDLYGLELDRNGWIELETLARALAGSRPEWRDLAAAEIRAMVAAATKQRYEIRGERIRARYGHSLPEKIEGNPVVPPALLYHGTTPEALPRIRTQGLKPMRRHYVHLSPDPETATLVAERRSKTPVIIEVRARDAHAEGLAFYRGNDQVWLSDPIPASYLRLPKE
ncbi:MAG: RNA 2'-phosphotransferase [Kiloniellales bacterium]|nr:RNA 2'-phosphotransferase [Kiloniellales bacterium]